MRKIENAAITFFTILGLFYVFFVPPFQHPDEIAHFYRLNSILNLDINVIKVGDTFGSYQESGLVEYIESNNYLVGKMDEKYTYKKLYVDSHVGFAGNEKRFVTHSALNHSILGYIPQIFGSIVGKIIFTPFDKFYTWQAKLYMARLGSVLFSIIILLYFRNILRDSFKIVVPFLLIPMASSIGSAVSPDVVLNMTIVLFLSMFYKVYTTDDLTNRNFFALVALFFIFVSVKFAYLPLGLLFILLFKKVEESFRPRHLWVLLVTTLLALLLSAYIFKPLYQDAQVVTQNQQLTFVLSNPIGVINIVFQSILKYFDYYFISFVYNAGSLDTNIPFTLLLLCFYLTVIIGITNNKPNFELDTACISTLLVSSVITVFLIYLFTYIGWTSLTKGIGYGYVEGVQGRYFLPLYPLFTMVTSNYLFVKSNKTITTIYFYLISAVFLMLIVTILLRYWIK